MSTLRDQIKAKCTTIAQNTKKIYDKGFADGKASVKHITFSISLPLELMIIFGIQAFGCFVSLVKLLVVLLKKNKLETPVEI